MLKYIELSRIATLSQRRLDCMKHLNADDMRTVLTSHIIAVMYGLEDAGYTITPPNKRVHPTGASGATDNQQRDTRASG
jgi:hypothetical protein